MALVTSVDVNPILNWLTMALHHVSSSDTTRELCIPMSLLFLQCTMDIAIIVTNLFNMCKKRKNCYEITVWRSLELLYLRSLKHIMSDCFWLIFVTPAIFVLLFLVFSNYKTCELLCRRYICWAFYLKFFLSIYFILILINCNSLLANINKIHYF